MTPTPIPSEVSVVGDERLADAHKRLQEILAYFDEEANEALANETERGDLWSDIEIPVADLRTMLALSRRSLAADGGVEPVALIDQAMDCDAWYPWLSDIVELTNQAADAADMSTEQAVAYGILQALASRTPNTEVVVKGLEWEEDEPGWWCAQPAAMIGGFGYEVRVTDSGKVRARRGRDDWTAFDGTLAEAKAAAQADFDQRIRSALAEPSVSVLARAVDEARATLSIGGVNG